MLPENLGKSALNRVINFYSLVFESKYGFKPIVKYPMLGKLLKPILSEFSEYQVALLILIYMHWRGANNDDDFEKKKLENKAYPLQWFPSGVNIYRAFASNYLGVNFNDETDVKDYVIKTAKGLKLRYFNEINA